MGYTTRFSGAFNLSRELTFKEAKTLLDFHEMEPDKIESTHPESYLQWVPTEDLKHIVWDGNEKFYKYVEWLEWLIKICLTVRGIVLNGQVVYSGEDASDNGTIIVENNEITKNPHDSKGSSPLKRLTRIRLSEMVLEGVK